MGRLLEKVTAGFKRSLAYLSTSIADSEGLDVTDFVAAIEHHFQVHLAPKTWESLNTLGDVCDRIAENLPPALNVDAEMIWMDVRRISSEEFGVDATDLEKGTRFVEDLCC